MGQQVFFIDASVAGANELQAALQLSVGEDSKVFVLENSSNAFEQMDAALETLGGVQVDALHIYAHGAAGNVTLGGMKVDEAALDQCAVILDRIGDHLKRDGDILLYSCNTAQDKAFVERLAALTRADVAASTDITGNASNWQLEYNAGKVETPSYVLPGYNGSFQQDTTRPTITPGLEQWGSLKGEDEGAAETLVGSVTNDKLYAIAKDDSLTATTDSNDGDVLAGGDGNDIYYIEDDRAIALEDADNGNDTLVSRVADFDLSDSDFDNGNTHIENIVLEAVDGIGAEQNFTGSAVSQTITGNALNNKLVGMGGVDYLEGGDGDDSLDGGSGDLTGSHADTADTMVGGKGDDMYIIRDKEQVVIEKAKEGTDEVYSFVNYTLDANVENLTLLDNVEQTGADHPIYGTGNASANVLRGNSAGNYLSGLAGNDTLHGGKSGGVDTLDGGAGNDVYYVYRDHSEPMTGEITGDVIIDSAGKDTIISSVNYHLEDAAQIEELKLTGEADWGTGNSLNNRIVGNETKGSYLDGGKGNDTLVGGYADDAFYVDSTGDKIEDLGGENDAVYATANINLANSRQRLKTSILMT
ncbi:MAG: DUF4347 domain-containing protein [Desulfovibrio sp.]|nr:DUF4347 domain-containing protein [Desulfovibrio sp.]